MRAHRADHHTALRSEILQKAPSRGIDFLVAKLQDSKDEIAFSIHADPTSFTLSGLQQADLLANLGFSKERCPFTARGECLTAWVPAEFPLNDFAEAFPQAFSQLETAERH